MKCNKLSEMMLEVCMVPDRARSKKKPISKD